MSTYELVSERLGLRRWRDSDIDSFAALNNDVEVMQYFPRTLSRQETQRAIWRFNAHLDAHGFTYYAVDEIQSKQFVGFVGLKIQLFDHPMTPMVDCGWRLCKQAWGKGFATEAALRCLDFAFNDLAIHEVSAIAPQANLRSLAVMSRIGMQLADRFRHPSLDGDSPLVNCVRYAITKSEFENHRSGL